MCVNDAMYWLLTNGNSNILLNTGNANDAGGVFFARKHNNSVLKKCHLVRIGFHWLLYNPRKNFAHS